MQFFTLIPCSFPSEGDEPGSQSTETAVSTPLESLAVADKNPTPEKDNEEEVKKEESERKEVTSIKKGEKVISGGSAIKTVQGRTCSVCGKVIEFIPSNRILSRVFSTNVC